MPRFQYYVIVSNETNFVALDMSKDADYAKILEQERKKELKSPHPTVVPKACLLQEPGMLLEEYTDEETQTTQKRFKEELVVARGDAQGRIWIDPDKPEVCRRILRNLRVQDKSVHLDPEGLMLPEEQTEEEKKKTQGGRPPRRR